MNELTEKLLLIAAGAAVGAVGYMAIKHPDELNRPLKKSIFPVFTPKTCSPQQLA